MTGCLVELIEADLLPLRRRRIKRDGTGDERKLEVAFPVRTQGHVTNSYATQNHRDKTNLCADSAESTAQ